MSKVIIALVFVVGVFIIFAILFIFADNDTVGSIDTTPKVDDVEVIVGEGLPSGAIENEVGVFVSEDIPDVAEEEVVQDEGEQAEEYEYEQEVEEDEAVSNIFREDYKNPFIEDRAHLFPGIVLPSAQPKRSNTP